VQTLLISNDFPSFLSQHIHCFFYSLLDSSRQLEERLISIYQWGSRVYGTASNQSDFDFMVVAKRVFPTETPVPRVRRDQKDPPRWLCEIFDDGIVNATFVTAEQYKEMVRQHCYLPIPLFSHLFLSISLSLSLSLLDNDSSS
jgi:hypothetical protein